MSVFSDKGGTNANGPQRSYVQQPGNMLTGFQGGTPSWSGGQQNMLSSLGSGQMPGVSGLYDAGSQPQTSGLPFQPSAPQPELLGPGYEQTGLPPPSASPAPQQAATLVGTPMPSGLPFMPDTPAQTATLTAARMPARQKAAPLQDYMMNMGFQR